MSPSILFNPLQVGHLTLSHRIVLAPLTRGRATKDHVHTQLGVDYYSQRSAVPGSLLITEATVIHPAAGAYSHAPYIYTDTQVQAWKEVSILPPPVLLPDLSALANRSQTQCMSMAHTFSSNCGLSAAPQRSSYSKPKTPASNWLAHPPFPCLPLAQLLVL